MERDETTREHVIGDAPRLRGRGARVARPATVAALALTGLCAASPGGAQPAGGAEIVVRHVGERPSVAAPAEHFTGAAWVDQPLEGTAPSRISGATVTFAPGARTAWHSHPLGQTLIVTAGVGWVQEWGGPVREIRPGDVVWIPPGVKHWHGASSTTGMTHIAFVERLDGKSVDWMEKVGDDQYHR